ncbi:MAG TPA: transglutaminase-like domain-containing protein [Candidatus Synoicihabitans sp.]|nr:transglutaminase-like domain-containing protein [Candidatus Synoicihabitans sp.]
MTRPTLSSAERDALRGLLDDSSPSVRRALLARFHLLGTEAVGFLRAIAEGSNRPLAWHARWFLDELKFSDPVADFRGFIRSLNYELETGAMLLARTVRPDLDAGQCCSILDGIASRCRELIVEPSSIREKCRVINRVLYHDYGFHGNVEAYTDPDNSFIDQVLTRHKGIPISLCTVYLLVAHRLGVDLEPVGLPGHFMVGCYVEDRPFFIDAFDGGIFRTPEEIMAFLRSHDLTPKLGDLAPTPVREVLCRSCRNLINHFEIAGDAERSRLFAGFVAEFEATYERHTL